jgi:PAS domain S-box-containing protein
MTLQGHWDYAALVSIVAATTFLKTATISAAIASLLSTLAGLLYLRMMRRTRVGEGELLFRAAAQAAPAILWTARPDGSVDFVSDQLYGYAGVTLEQAKDWGWTEMLHPDDLAECEKRWQHSLRSGDVYEIEYRLRRNDGTYRWFLAKGNPLRDEQGRIIKWVGACTDIEDQSTTSRFSNGKSATGPKNWPAPTRACKKKWSSAIMPGGNWMSRTHR